MAEIENLKIGNGGTLHIVGNEDIVANVWQAGKTYVKNKSYVIREHRLYVCNVTHTSVEPFDATKWTEITIGDAIGNNIGDLSTLTTTVKSSLVGAVNEVDAEVGTKAKITRKKYSVTLASNSYIAPFTYFYRLDIGSDTILYGSPIGAWANNAAVTPHIENSNSVDFLGGSAITCDVYVFFASNVDVIS